MLKKNVINILVVMMLKAKLLQNAKNLILYVFQLKQIIVLPTHNVESIQLKKHARWEQIRLFVDGYQLVNAKTSLNALILFLHHIVNVMIMNPIAPLMEQNAFKLVYVLHILQKQAVLKDLMEFHVDMHILLGKIQELYRVERWCVLICMVLKIKSALSKENLVSPMELNV
jgi:hypothetical protein